MQTTAIRTVANPLPENEIILLTLLISKRYIPYTDFKKICEITALADHNCVLSTDNNGGGGPQGQAAPGVNTIRSALFRRRHTTPPQAQATARQASVPALPAHTGTREQRNRPGCQRPIRHKYLSCGNNIMAFAILFVFLHRATGGAKQRPHSRLRPHGG